MLKDDSFPQKEDPQEANHAKLISSYVGALENLQNAENVDLVGAIFPGTYPPLHDAYPPLGEVGLHGTNIFYPVVVPTFDVEEAQYLHL